VKGLFWTIGLFALAVVAALAASLNQGYVLLVLPSLRAEISLNLFLLGIGLAFLAFYFALRALALTFSVPGRVGQYRARRQQEKANATFQDALRLLFEGRFGQALKKAGESSAAGFAPGLSALIAARAAQRMRETQKQQGWLERARNDDARTQAATLMLEAEMMCDDRRYDDALVALDRLLAVQGRHIAALKLELRARRGIGDWDGVLRLARQLAKRDAMPPEVLREIRAQAHQRKLAALAQDDDANNALDGWLKALSADERVPRVLLAGACALVANGRDDEAGALLTEALSADDGSAHDELVDLYGRLHGSDCTARIAQAEKWLLRQPADGSLLLALGRMCRQQRLWGKAQSYLEAALAVAGSKEAHLELARLFDELDRRLEADQHYRLSAQQEMAARTA
jgi:HemY protein